MAVGWLKFAVSPCLARIRVLSSLPRVAKPRWALSRVSTTLVRLRVVARLRVSRTPPVACARATYSYQVSFLLRLSSCTTGVGVEPGRAYLFPEVLGLKVIGFVSGLSELVAVRAGLIFIIAGVVDAIATLADAGAEVAMADRCSGGRIAGLVARDLDYSTFSIVSGVVRGILAKPLMLRPA